MQKKGNEAAGKNYNDRLASMAHTAHCGKPMRGPFSSRGGVVFPSIIIGLIFTLAPSHAIAVAGETNAPGVQSDTAHATAPAATQNQEEQYAPRQYVLRVWHSLTGHLHNKLVHVPIGFGLSAFVLSLVSLRWKEVEPGIRWLVILAALGSIAAFVTGTRQAVSLEGGSKDWVINLHRVLGIMTMATLCTWSAFLWFPRVRRWSIVIGALSTALILITGFFGGILAHG